MARMNWGRTKRYREDKSDRLQWSGERTPIERRGRWFPGAVAGRCQNCNQGFWRKDDEEWKLLCVPCYKTMKLAQGQVPSKKVRRLDAGQVAKRIIQLRKERGDAIAFNERGAITATRRSNF